jgi:hypothetical protein
MRQAPVVAAVWVLFLVLLYGHADAAAVTGIVGPPEIAPEVEVCMVEPPPSETCTAPNREGSYTLSGLPAGVPLTIEFMPSYRSHYAIQYYDGASRVGEATSITFVSSEGQQPFVDADLEVGGVITGTVTAASGGTSLVGVEVCVREAGTGVSYGCTETGEAGDYALGGLPPGAYVVGFRGHGATAEYEPEYYDGEATLGQATSIPVTPGATVTGIDAAVAKGAAVTGMVTAAATGTPLPGVPVCLFGATAPLPVRCAYSGPGGFYSFVGLVAGEYQIGFSLSSTEIGGEAISYEDDGYLTQFFRGVANRSEAQVLNLVGEGVVSAVNAALLAPSLPPPIIPFSPSSSNLVVPPPTVSLPTKPKPHRCKKGYVRMKVKGRSKCVNRAKRSHHGSKKKRHHHRSAHP